MSSEFMRSREVRVIGTQAECVSSHHPQLVRQPAAEGRFWMPRLQAAWPTHYDRASPAVQIVARHVNDAHGSEAVHVAGNQHRSKMPVPPVPQGR